VEALLYAEMEQLAELKHAMTEMPPQATDAVPYVR
jgi:hypothetical protein